MAIRFLDDQAPAPKKIGRVRFLEEGEEPPQPSLMERAQPYIDEGIQKGAEMSTAAQEKYLAPVMRPIMEAGDKVGRAMSTFQTGSPLPWEVAKQGVGAAMEGIEKAGEATSEFLGEKGVNPYLAATAGLAVQNIPSFLVPGSKAGTTGRSLLKASVPLERQAAVSAAERMGVPLTRAEQSGSQAMAGFENFMEKTPLGSGPVQAFREMRAGKLDAAKTGLQSELGTPADTYTAGQSAQRGLKDRASALRDKKNELFDKVPTEVEIPLQRSRSVADDIINEQKDFAPTTQDPELQRMAGDVQNLISGSGKPNFQQIKRLREVLNQKIKSGNPGVSSGLSGQSTPIARDYMRLKDALDEDLNSFVGTADDPSSQLVAKEFKDSYRKANAFSGAYNKIFKSDEALALADTAPEKVVDSIFKRNNETAIKRFRALAGEDGFQAAKKKFTQELLESPNVETELAKYQPGTLNAIYRPDELKQIRGYGQTQGLTKTVTSLPGTQGSARSNITAAANAGAGAAITAFATGHPVVGAALTGLYAAPAALSRAYLASGEGLSTALGKGTVNSARRGLISAYIMKEKERRGQ